VKLTNFAASCGAIIGRLHQETKEGDPQNSDYQKLDAMISNIVANKINFYQVGGEETQIMRYLRLLGHAFSGYPSLPFPTKKWINLLGMCLKNPKAMKASAAEEEKKQSLQPLMQNPQANAHNYVMY
jgi:hypothetical protein